MSDAINSPLSRLEKSTNVRAKMQSAWLKRLFGRLAVAAPPLAGWLAERLFMTPPHFPAPAAERAALSSARRFQVPFGARRLMAWFWAGGGPTVLLVHGWGGRAGQLAPIGQRLLAQGYSVVAFDAPAHGESEGQRTNLVEFADAIEAVVGACGPMSATVAHSMGGAATALALGRKLPLGRVVMISSPSDLIIQTRRFARALGLPESTRARLQRRVERRVGLPMSALNLLSLPRPTEPVLVIHDRLDGEIPYEEGRELAQHWSAELLTTEGLGHRRVLRDDAVLARISAFLSAGAHAHGCATPACPRMAATGADSWPKWKGYCATCALELDLRNRERAANASLVSATLVT